MNIRDNLIFIKGEDKTRQIQRCNYENGQYYIKFSNSPKGYYFGFNNVQWLGNPQKVNPNNIKISYKGIINFEIV